VTAARRRQPGNQYIEAEAVWRTPVAHLPCIPLVIPGSLASEQTLQFCHRHGGVSQNSAERSFGHVASRMDGDGSTATVWMAHDVVAASYPRHLEPSLF
jgi:hypothetical protein